MERIRLSKNEKAILKALRDGTKLPDKCLIAVRLLEDKELVKSARIEGGGFETLRLTPYGRYYISQNPKLRNPLLNISNEDLPYIAITALSVAVLALAIKVILMAL